MKTFLLALMLALTGVTGAVVISDPAAADWTIRGGYDFRSSR
jgi:hypothetical protein